MVNIEHSKIPGQLALMKLSEENNPGAFPDQDQKVIRVASQLLFNIKQPLKIADVEFKGVHYVPQWRSKGTLETPHSWRPPQFSVAISDRALKHPQSHNAQKIIENLQTIRSPLIGMEHAATSVLEKIDIGGFPPVVTIVATEDDFSDNDGFRFGRWVSVADSGIHLGTIHNKLDLVFIIIFGSKAWEKGYSTYASPQTFFTVQHELSHLLTLVELSGDKINQTLSEDYFIEPILGRPIWEGLADCISGRAEFIADEEVYTRDSRYGYHPEKTFLEQQNRTLGDAPNYLNELLVGRLLKIWQNQIIGKDISKISNYDAALAFLDAAFGRGPEATEEAEKGWLVKKIFAESGFDYEKAVNDLRNLSDKEIQEIIFPLTPYHTQEDFRKRLIKEWQEFAPLWQPFGEDSLTSG